MNKPNMKKTPLLDNQVHLQYANSETSGKLLKINEASVDDKFTCPLCGKPVFPKKENIAKPSFVHEKGVNCIANELLVRDFSVNLVLKLITDNKEITVPEQSFRINRKSSFVLTKKEINQKIGLEPDIKLQTLKTDDNLIGIITGKTWESFPIAIVVTYNQEIPKKLKYELINFGYCILEIALPPMKSGLYLDRPEENIKDTIIWILESNRRKKWIQAVPYPASIEYLKKVSPNGTFIKKDYVYCPTRKCDNCKYQASDIVHSYCLKNYLNPPSNEFSLEVTPQNIKEVDEYIDTNEKAMRKSMQQKDAWSVLQKSLRYLNQNIPSYGRSSELINAGTSYKSLIGYKNGEYDINWRFDKKKIVILITPKEIETKDPSYLFEIKKDRDYCENKNYRTIRVFKTNRRKKYNPDSLIRNLKFLDDDYNLWEEITFSVKSFFSLEDYCEKLYDFLINSDIEQTKLAKKILKDAYIHIQRNGSFYHENRTDIFGHPKLCYLNLSDNVDEGSLIFNFTGLENKYGYPTYSAKWKIELGENNSIHFFKNQNSVLDSKYTETEDEECSFNEFFNRWNYLIENCDFKNLFPIVDGTEFRNGLTSETLQTSELGKILFNKEIDLKTFWEELEKEKLIPYEQFREILLGSESFSETATVKFVRYLRDKFNLTPDKTMKLIDS